jgi:hypothetical protein
VSHDPPSEQPPPAGALVRPFLDSDTDAAAADRPDEPAVEGGTLRPFLLTDGRVATDDGIALETQVVTTDSGCDCAGELGFERRDILTLCREPLSVAEIAARLSLHLGVVRVLVGDLAGEGHLSVHLPNADAPTDVDTLLRVIRGLRAIG